jgi:hypothetical protein
MARTTASSYTIGKKVKGVFPTEETKLEGVVTDRSSTTIFVHWKGYSSPIEYSAWQMDYIKRI